MRTLLALLMSILLTGPALAAGHDPAGQVILTVGGDLPNPNRPGADPDRQDFMGYLDMEFPGAYGFDEAMLTALGTQSITATLLDEPEATYTGPLLTDVMKAAGAEGKSAFPMAFDGYQVEIAWDYMTQHQPIVATHANGAPLDVGRLGPVMIVFPVVQDKELYDSFEASQVWAMFLIEVE